MSSVKVGRRSFIEICSSVGVDLLAAATAMSACHRTTSSTIKVFPRANHGLLEAETGDGKEWARTRRFVPGYFDTVVNWIHKRVEN